MRSAALLSFSAAPLAAAAPCPPAFLKHEGSYIVSHADKGQADPKFFAKAGVYGTKSSLSPHDASFKGAQDLCLSSDVCQGFTFQVAVHGGADDISNGVFFYGNGDVYKSSSQPAFVSYTVNPSYRSAPGCKSGAGPSPSPGGNSTGGAPAAAGGCGGSCYFLIAFFCGGTVYLAAGFTYNYKRMEKRGVEAIPQVDFWKDLPFLVKDGMVFSFQKAREAAARRGGDGSYTTV